MTTERPPSPADRIKAKAQELGFDDCRISPPTLPPAVEDRLRAFLGAGRHGEMSWMETRVTERASPKGLWPNAKSVIMLGLNYGPSEDPLPRLERRDKGVISVYAQNDDYHDLIKKRLKQIGRWMAEEFGCELKVFVDTAPVMEKPLAAQAGLGWQGKHTNLVSRTLGSWLFLGAIYTDMTLQADDPETDHCGSCRACLDICPTAAFPAAYQLDARKCISYLTIEHKGTIPEEFREKIGNRIYGCDDCLAVCPWNKFAEAAREVKLIARAELESPSLDELSALDDAAFRALFRKNPIKRIGRDRFIRNVMIAIGNSGNPDLLSSVIPRLQDSSAEVRDMAAWAQTRLTASASHINENEPNP